MENLLDLRTLMLILGIDVLLFCIVVVDYFLHRKTYKGFGLITSGMLGYGIGSILVGLTGITPDFISIVMANLLIMVGNILFLAGFNAFAGKDFNLKQHAALILSIYGVILSYFTLVESNFVLRIGLLSIMTAVYFASYLWIVLKYISPKISTYNRLFVFSIFLISSAMLVRAVHFLLPGHDSAHSILEPSLFHSYVILAILLSVILFVIGFLDLNSALLELELRMERALLKDKVAWQKRMELGLKRDVTMFSMTLKGVFEYLSEGFEYLTGQSATHAKHQSWLSVFKWDVESKKRIMENYRHLLKHPHDATHFEVSFKHEDGIVRHLEISNFMSHNPVTHKASIQGIAFNVTERKKMEEQIRLFQHVFNSTSASVVITNPNGTIVYTNPAFSVNSGYQFEEINGKNPRVLQSGLHDQEFYKGLWDSILSGESWRSRICNRKKDGTLFWELATISPVVDEQGRVQHFVALKSDITAEKQLEDLKEDVERMMHHDMKQPLMAIMGFPELLRKKEYLLEEDRTMLNYISEAGAKMKNMISLSLDMYKMEKGEYQYIAEDVNLIRFLQSAGRTVEALMQRKHVHIQFFLNDQPSVLEEVLEIPANPNLLENVLNNLLLNAVEASPFDHEITVNMISDSELHQLEIENTGVVPEQIRNVFFEKYKTFGKAEGTGLGTYTAKLLAAAMGYELEMETSDEANRTKLTLTFPSS